MRPDLEISLYVHVSIMLGFVRPMRLGLFSLLVLIMFYATYFDVSRSLSPQGCRMSWMSPSYVLQSQFNSSHTPLGSRYSLWLYREVGWDVNQVSSSHMHTRVSIPTPNTHRSQGTAPLCYSSQEMPARLIKYVLSHPLPLDSTIRLLASFQPSLPLGP